MRNFSYCEICGATNWSSVWDGQVRDGKFGHLTETTVVARCGGCGVERLDESTCKDESFYKSSKYRELLDQDATAEGFFSAHDPLQLERLNVFPPYVLRGKRVADVGSAAGAFLDHVRGLSKSAVAIEPSTQYHDSLSARGFKVYPFAADAAKEWAGRIDYAFSFSVIEHVVNPKKFLSDIAVLLGSAGQLLVSTPNRRDLLMDLLPDDYPAFFYRTVHRWYFDVDSLAECASNAGLTVVSMRCVHRFGLGNALMWLRDRCPPGRVDIPEIANSGLDTIWRRDLEQRFVGDYLYATLVKE